VSKYRKMRTEFKSRSHLREALKASGVLFEECQPGTEKHLIGYEGDTRTETATFIVRRSQIGSSSNDMGYHWDSTSGCFTEVVSDFDSRQHKCTAIRQAVKREYAVCATVSQARAKGYAVKRQNQADGTVQLVVTGRI